MVHFVKTHRLFTAVITIVVLIAVISTVVSLSRNDSKYVTSSNLETIKIGESEKTIKSTFGEPDSISSESKAILRDLKKYDKFKSVSDNYIGSELSKVTKKINNQSLESVLHTAADSKLNLLQYPYGKGGDESVTFIFKDSKLIYVFAINS
ncbi:hypothetical protein EFL83_07375 [Weissella cibaria]|uniref:hypothetical protein n=1 Tax=Weissella cibaria TaxID=137591 RepID=UPI00223C3EF3|nr:hypothetical protein [Weissella cibaria]MCS9988518.1 hypothetical protein [Weissella cibaria]